MRILHVNKYLYRRGGAEAYMLDVAELQRARGHEVDLFGMAHADNPPLTFADRFPSYVELDPLPPSRTARARVAARMLWSTQSQAGMRAVVEEWDPDVVHLHNVYHQLSPSILAPLRHHRAAVVMTLHDYKLACPSYRLLAQGRPCDACLAGGLRQAVRHRCKDGSLAASGLLAAETWLHRAGHAYDRIDVLISPSEFLAGVVRRAGVDGGRLVVVPHAVATDGVPVKDTAGGDLLFAGRLSPEKGVDVLLDALARVPGARLRIAGDGPQEAVLRRLADARAPGRVTFLGRLDRAAVHDEMRRSCAVVVPSQWHENQPITVLEAFACGVPVVATTLGGLPELVTDGVDGLLVVPGDARALGAALAAVAEDPERALAMGRAGRRKVAARFTPVRHLDALERTYARARRRSEVPA